MANIELAVPNTPQTVFRLGSVTKQFTAMAIMILQERGKLRVSDPACQYLAECPAAWRPLTDQAPADAHVWHSELHGISRFRQSRGCCRRSSAELVGRLVDKPLEFAPGDKFAYSNSGYYLLGLIIERASGKPYADFLQENDLRAARHEADGVRQSRLASSRIAPPATRGKPAKPSTPHIWT